MWNLQSRIHHLNHFPKQHCECYVKREDELSCGISGSKIRKYSSLVPYLLKNSIAHLIIIAGPQSNNLLAALQVARELRLDLTVFLLKPKTPTIQGNFKLSLLFLDEKEIIWVERADWLQVNDLALAYRNQLTIPAFILEEGACVKESMPGAMTLADDIIRNETEFGGSFQHIFIDAGTGFAAAALIQRMTQLNHTAIIHVLLLADSKDVFKDKLEHWLNCQPSNYHCFVPTSAKAFGSVNQTIKNEIRRMAREEGILVDPIYSAKLFHEARFFIEMQQLTGKVLLIHSGGLLTMAGFNF